MAKDTPRPISVFWMGVLFKPKYTDAGRRIEAKNWSVRIQYQRNRRAFSLGTPNQAAAAARAKDIYLHLQANGWERTIARYRPELVAKKKHDATIGEFFSEVKAKADGNPKTIEGYCKSFRKIAADIMDIENTPKKFDYRSGGHQRWLEQVHSIPSATIGPNMVQAWKRSFLEGWQQSGGVSPGQSVGKFFPETGPEPFFSGCAAALGYRITESFAIHRYSIRAEAIFEIPKRVRHQKAHPNS